MLLILQHTDSLSFFSNQKLGRDPSDEDCFFDLLSKFQSSRMDDQRCRLDEPQNGDGGEGAADSVPPLNEMIGELLFQLVSPVIHCSKLIHFFFFGTLDPSITTSPQTEELFDLIASSQSRRLDDQRVNVGSLPGLRITHNNLGHLVGEADHQEPSDDFFNMLIKCQVGAPAFILQTDVFCFEVERCVCMFLGSKLLFRSNGMRHVFPLLL